MEALMRWRKRFLYEFIAGLSLYMVLLATSLWMQVTWQPAGALLFAVAVAPMLGCGAVLWAVIRAVRLMDELERQVQFEALVFAFVATAFLTFGWGFVEISGAPKLPAFGVWPIMATFWILGWVAANRRYR